MNFIIGLFFGLCVGLMVAYLNRKSMIMNAEEPYRIMYKGEFYKMFRLSRNGDPLKHIPDPGEHLRN